MARTTPTTSGRRLVIVESPRKAQTIAGYLGRGYDVEASIGHIRDLPQNAAEVPAALKKESWGRLGVNVEQEFEPVYVVPSDKKAQVRKLKDALKGASELFLATDEDREGEAIAWHLREVLQPKVPVRRMVFHEITPEAIERALTSPRDIDQGLVDAQETRRILDRLYGYEVSPVLWKKVMPRLSAGRVQSVATRLVVDRERERIAFRAASYWDLSGVFEISRDTSNSGNADPTTLPARLVAIDGRRVAQGRDFTSTGELSSGVLHLDEDRAVALAAGLHESLFDIRSVDRRPYTRRPYAPFRTTTLQQEASRKLGFSARRTMQVAQRLYENGHITYMRTDSTTLSESAINAARTQASQLYGRDYVPEVPRRYDSKVKNAQEAHEGVRPAGEVFRTPAETMLHGDEFRLYELIWQRTIASQMRDATGQSVSIRLGGRALSGEDAEFGASGRIITFPGFLRAYVEGADDPEAELDDRERRLPQVSEGDVLTAVAIDAEGHTTKPPARYTEASLVKELEDREIGRPSTYASIIGTILDRGYVFKKGTALVPSFLAFAVVRLLEQHFARLVDYDFTAQMEDVLDEIAIGDAQMAEWLTRFYFGADVDRSANGSGMDARGLKALVDNLGDIDARDVNSFPLGDGVVVRVGRYGPYVEQGEQRATIPDDMAPDELTLETARELLERPSGDRLLGADPATGYDIVAKDGRYGPYVTEVLPDDVTKSAKPRTASLFKAMSLESVTLEDALRLLTLPRVLGTDPADGVEVSALNGRYGPYVKKGSESRSLSDEESLFTVTLADALALLAQPRQRAGRGAASATPLRELGPDPSTGKPIVVREGRFGPYVTDGEINASLRKGDDVATMTEARAMELLADKRAKGPSTPRKRTAKTASKSAAKKAAQKTAQKTATAKRP